MDSAPPPASRYAFTLNPNPQRYRSKQPIDQWLSLLNCIFTKRLMNHVFSIYEFIPECTQMGNIHVHGWYEVKDWVKYYNWFLPACKQWAPFGLKVKKLIDQDKWVEYMDKASEEMEDVISPAPYLITRDMQEYQRRLVLRLSKPAKHRLERIPLKKGVIKYTGKYYK